MAQLDGIPGTDAAPEDAHAQTRELMPAYATALFFGRPAEACFATAIEHLAGCAECRADLDELMLLVEPLFDGTLEPAPSPASFDLAFLATPSPPPAPPRAEARLTAAQGFGQLVLVLDQQLQALHRLRADLLGRPPARAASAYVMRGGPLVDYEPDPATTAGFSVSIQLYRSDADPQRCDLQLALIPPDHLEVPNGIALRLQVDDQQWEETTDETGLCIFPAAVPLDASSMRISAEVLA